MKQLDVREMSLCAMFAALMAVGAYIKISIPTAIYELHFSLQWLFVLLAALLLEKKIGAYSVAVYLTMGLIGIPVFASGGGLGYVLKPTFGFLLGFLLSAYLMCEMKETTKNRVVITFMGLIVYYLTGIFYFYLMATFVLNMKVGWELIIIDNLLTFIPDLILCIIAIIIARRLGPLIE